MKIKTEDFRVPEGKDLRLNKWATETEPVYKSKDEYKQLLRDSVEQMSDLQEKMYAQNRYSMLLIFQAMDAAGKDGAIQHVMSGINPSGCQVFNFKQPSSTELDHDFLWRTYLCLPERGRIGIFNRSYYEEVLIVRVHPELLQYQNLPEEVADPDTIWKGRFRSIRDMESHLHRSGTRVVKFFLHLSKEEQRKRFLARIDEPEKNWKFNTSDVKEREHWDEYQAAYAECLSETSAADSPWYVVPADDKENARLIISQVIVDTLESLKVNYPAVTEAQRSELQSMRVMLVK
ncbi:MAG: polyphosphate kinase 2 family protein [Akkermansiaceae bacterium]|nr:polyphosphate kinase 2 family protein [Armatimonadota bacterium]